MRPAYKIIAPGTLAKGGPRFTDYAAAQAYCRRVNAGLAPAYRYRVEPVGRA